MAREINWNDPDSWDDDDKNYLRQRIDRVPAEHRHLLNVATPQSPVESVTDVSGATADMARLSVFIRDNFPDEPGSPVEVAIRLLSDDEGVTDGDDPGYEQWKSAELKAEVEKRQAAGRNIQPDGNTRAAYAAALRADDDAE